MFIKDIVLHCNANSYFTSFCLVFIWIFLFEVWSLTQALSSDVFPFKGSVAAFNSRL